MDACTKWEILYVNFSKPKFNNTNEDETQRSDKINLSDSDVCQCGPINRSTQTHHIQEDVNALLTTDV